MLVAYSLIAKCSNIFAVAMEDTTINQVTFMYKYIFPKFFKFLNKLNGL